MRHLAAYMLAKISGIAEPTEADVSKILKSADVEVDATELKAVVDAIKATGKPYEELIEAGKKRMASLPSGGAAAPVAAAAVKEEAKKEKTEEEQIVGGFAFGSSSSSEEESS
ncbi:Putative_60S acidic ribosomal protein P2 [Hexamita inflata]|uniref:60S acidic ribosomal protein P2 n=1 Tax=Hexamita inflata TaxID=28002 RepID=A0AA86PF28_9EUKA|nr:Putative 60S acidic ribosomal protein P2 [Hexamita inflata]